MTAWNPRANDIFARAIEFDDAAERAAFLDRECGSDHGLRARVQEMMASNDEAGGFLESPAHALRFESDDFKEFEIPSHFAQGGEAALDKTFSPSAGDTDHNHMFPDDSDEPIRTFGDYELLEEIARGGMGVVYKARQTKLNRIVALKMILTGQLASSQEIQRFQAEAEAAARLEHAGIVPVFEVGELDGRHFFSMGYVEGGSLSDRLKDGPLPPRKAATLTKQIAESVAYAHDNGVIHRDLKPANVLLDGDGRPKITDFGLAKHVEFDSGLTGTGQILGTPGFMSPEQARGQNTSVQPATDIYAVGAILYNLLTGRPPFQGSSPIETLKHVLEREPVSPNLLNPAVDVDLQTISLMCLEKDAEQRYLSAQELADELGRYLSGAPIHARPISTTARTWRWCWRNPIVAGLASAAVLFLIAGTVFSTIFAYRASQNAQQANANLADSEIQRKRANTNEKTATAREEEARALLQRVQEQAMTSRRNLYNAQMNMCGLSAESDGAVGLIQQQLSNWLPVEGQTDLRGWEWNFFNTHIHRAAKTIDLASQGFSLDWSPDGEHIAIGTRLGRIAIFDKHGNRVAHLDGHDHFVRAVKWHPDGRRLASGCQFGTLFLWEDPLHSEEVRQLPCVKDVILSLDWSFDGAILAVMFEGQIQVQLWQPDTEQEPTSIAGTSPQLRFSPVDRRLACGYKDDVRIWEVDDPQKPQVVATLKDNGAWTKSVAWSPSGKRLAAGFFNGDIRLWNPETDEVETLSGHTDSVYHLGWSNNESRFVSGSHDYTVRVWDAEELSPVEVLRGHTDRVFAVQYSPDGTVIASTGEDGQFNLWTPGVAAIQHVCAETQAPAPTDNEPYHVEWNRMTGTIATSGSKHSMVRDSTTLEQISTFPGALVCWNRDGTLLASSEVTGITIRNAETGVVVTQANVQKAGAEDDIRIHALTWDPVHDRLAVACRAYTSGASAGAVFIWKIGQENPERVIDFKFAPYCAEWSPDGKKLAVGCAYTNFIVWEEDNRSLEPAVVPVGEEAVHSIRWSPDGSYLAMGCGDHSIQIQNVDSGQTTALRGHTFPVWDIAWNPQQNRLASASGDRTVKIWDTADSKLITTLAMDAPTRAVAWHSDGKRLAALSAKQTLKIWDASERNGAESAIDGLTSRPSVWDSADIPKNKTAPRDKPADFGADGWSDLLKEIDLERDQHTGTWKWDGDSLLSDTQPYSRIHVMATAPDRYRLRTRFTRISGIEAVAFTIPVGDAQCRVVLNGWNGPHCGVDQIDERSPPYENPSHALFNCETGVEYLLEVDVISQRTQASIAAFINGKKLFRFEGESSKLSLDSKERLRHKNCFGLGSYKSEFRFSELKIRATEPTE